MDDPNFSDPKKSNSVLKIDDKFIGDGHPTYFIADIAANHDGDLGRAKELIFMAKESGADAAKFQHFQAEKIVSDIGFKKLGDKKSHQANWNKSVYEVYREAAISLDWTEELKSTCDKAKITFFTSPYDFEIVDHIDSFVSAYKIGSGDITWIDMIKKIASKNKTYILATGASSLNDVIRAVNAGISINPRLALLQCNTNYTGSVDNMRYVQLNVLKTYQKFYPDLVLGLSDHTPGHVTVLGAVTLGAKIIEKHFTDDQNRTGPDHRFSMDQSSWKEMVLRTRELEAALGGVLKKVEDNELETMVLQRRAIRAATNFPIGHVISQNDFIPLRPAPSDAILPYDLNNVIGRRLLVSKAYGEHLTWDELE